MVGKKKEQFADLLENYQKCYERHLDENRVAAPDFNPFALLKMTFDERTHSRILAWLLDSRESHSQGDLFFRHFLLFFDFSVLYDGGNYTVRQEHSGRESIIDILIYSSSFIFYIENKTISPEGPDQTNREYRDLERLRRMLNVRDIFPIFLNPYGVKADNKHFKTISYDQLALSFESALVEIQAPYIRSFVGSWISVLRQIKET